MRVCTPLGRNCWGCCPWERRAVWPVPPGSVRGSGIVKVVAVSSGISTVKNVGVVVGVTGVVVGVTGGVGGVTEASKENPVREVGVFRVIMPLVMFLEILPSSE